MNESSIELRRATVNGNTFLFYGSQMTVSSQSGTPTIVTGNISLAGNSILTRQSTFDIETQVDGTIKCNLSAVRDVDWGLAVFDPAFPCQLFDLL
jgi:hypothetical protein